VTQALSEMARAGPDIAAVLAQATPGAAAWPAGGEVTRGLIAVFVVFGLLALLAWLARRGTLGGLLARQSRSPVKVESAVPLGERRSLVIVSVEGRRLLLGLTPMQVSLVTELAATPVAKEPFDETLARSISSSSSSSAASSS
jgi:flagellar protein FliO/FliZ